MLTKFLSVSVILFCLAAASGDKTAFASPLFDMAQTVQVNGRGAHLTTIQNLAESNRIDSLGSEVFSVGAEIEKSADLEKLQVNSKNSTEMPQSLLSSQPCIVRDDFNRANSTNMGTNWTEQSGDFSISGNRAVGISDSEIVYNGNTTGDLACVDVYSGGNAQKVARILLKYTSSSDHLRVLLQDSEGDGLYDRIYFDREGFIFNQACATSLLTTPITSGRLTAYLDGTTLKGDIDNDFDGTIDQSYQCTNAPQKSGTKVVLSNFGPAQFDNFGTPPNTLTVTKNADTNDGLCNADCSLREAVAAAVAGDTIAFASPLFDSPITISINGQITIDKSLTINGRGARFTRIENTAAAGPTSRVFLITGSPVNLSGLTMTGGNLTTGGATTDGGGINNSGNLTLTNSAVSGNSATGNLVLGGGIYSISGTLTLINSTISGNSTVGTTVLGGGIYIQNNGATVINSTISGNSAVGSSIGQGGGINLNGSSVLNVTNSTFTGNFVGGGGSDGGGGICKGSAATINAVNTIISGNTAPVNPDLRGTPTAGSTNNLIGGNAGFLPLSLYGGTVTTQAISAESPAVNAGNNCVLTQTCAVANPPSALTTDQRGGGRVGNVDIGAFELPSALVVTNTNDSGAGSLRTAIQAANATTTDEVITFAIPPTDPNCANTVCTITLTSGELGVANETTGGFLMISNSTGAARLRISGNNATRVLNLAGRGVLALNGLTMTDGNAAINAGGAAITIFNSNITNNTSSGNGGGIEICGESVIANSSVTGNRGIFGGGIFNQLTGICNSYRNATLIINSTVSGNTATQNIAGGGGIYAGGNEVRIINTTVTNNTAPPSGLSTVGGLRVNVPNKVFLLNTIVAGNTGASPDIEFPFTSLGYNLIGNTSGTTVNGTTTGNILNPAGGALLAPLGFYGGQTLTHALASNSPAVNAGSSPNAPMTDQRGAARVGNVDIGAFEANSSANGGTFRAALPDGRLNSAYSYTLVPSNGTTTYQVSGGALPPGMNLTTAFAPNAVVALAGTPTSGGVFNFSITATSGANTSVTDYSLNVFVPTAAGVSVSGRVMTSDGRGLRNATVTMTDASGVTRSARTGTFGYYVFDDVGSGQVMTFNVKAKRASFTPQVVYIGDSITDLDFVEGVF